MNEEKKKETLEDIAMELLQGYEFYCGMNIDERSGRIDEDHEELKAEAREYERRIEAASK